MYYDDADDDDDDDDDELFCKTVDGLKSSEPYL